MKRRVHSVYQDLSETGNTRTNKAFYLRALSGQKQYGLNRMSNCCDVDKTYNANITILLM